MNAERHYAMQRAVAMAAPCVLAEQCNDGRYFFLVRPRQGLTCSVGLTLNVGQE